MDTISNIKLCRVPITYTNQLDFSSKEKQLEYFENNITHTYNKCSYQPRTGSIMIKSYVDDVSDSNYGFYENEYNGTVKTFFFFIAQRNYIAKNTTELIIQIDVFQTWHFDFYMGQCMVEREHITDDDILKNTYPEDFEIGDYVTRSRYTVSELTGNPVFCIGTTDYPESATGKDIGGIFGRTYSGFYITLYEYADYDKLSEYILDLMNAGKGDSIAFIFTFPSGMLEDKESGDIIKGIEGTLKKSISLPVNNIPQNFSWNSETYTPFNNKLLTYPYNYLCVKNASGSNVVLKRENFNSGTYNFLLEGVLTMNPTFSLTPQNYCGRTFSLEDSITLQGFGLCSWNNDNYANWFAQTQNTRESQSMNAGYSYRANSQVASNNFENANERLQTGMYKNVLNGTVGAVSSLARGNIAGGLTQAVTSVGNGYLDYHQGKKNNINDLNNSNLMNTTNWENTMRSIVASVKDAQVQPNTAKGDTSGSGLDLARNTNTFFIDCVQIKPEYAKIIDMYWQMFGYKVNQIKKPNFQTHERWNYIKTAGSNVYGEIPHSDINELNNIFNNGLTIWHAESYMYKYDVKNNVK